MKYEIKQERQETLHRWADESNPEGVSVFYMERLHGDEGRTCTMGMGVESELIDGLIAWLVNRIFDRKGICCLEELVAKITTRYYAEVRHKEELRHKKNQGL